MRYINIIIIVAITTGFITSCDLFRGGDHHGKKGGEVVWKVKSQDINTISTEPLIAKGRVYFIQDRTLKAYTLDKGTEVWSGFLKEKGLADYSRKLVKDNGKIFIDLGGEIRAYNMNTGSMIWNIPSNSTPKEQVGFGSPIMSQDAGYLYAGRKGYVLKVRKSDGQIVQRYPLDRLVPEGVQQGSPKPLISPFGDGILYVPTNYFDYSQPTPDKASGGNIFAFHAVNGDMLWERHITVTVPDPSTPAPDDSLTGSPQIYDMAVIPDKVIVLAGFYIVALNRQTGEPVWKTYFSKGGFDVGLAVKDDAVYAASIGRFATRVDINTGNVVWQRDITFSNTSIPTVENGRMYFNNSGGGGIWVLDTADGAVIFHKNTPNYKQDDFDVYISSLGVGEGYMVDVGSKAVYCLRVP